MTESTHPYHQKHHRLIIISFALYLVVMTILLAWQGVGFSADRYAFVLLLIALLIKRTRQFVLDWIPFLFILISYDFLRQFAGLLGPRVHFYELLNLEKFIFGGAIPSQWLQARFYIPGTIYWYDLIATAFYFFHFALPLAFGFLLWMDNKFKFRQFVVGITLLSYAAWITYIIYPAAPPWMASEKGFTSGIFKILYDVLTLLPKRLDAATLYNNANSNPVASIPSIHAAWTTMVLLFSVSFYKWKGLIFLPYAIILWLSLVYLGEHYVVDVALGMIYATIFFLLAKKLASEVKFLHGQAR
ncbi:phosphatase PAP2 family protein [Candidatus Daviesbacteria bacterium]|nr:phosphatase PAP2 family protein [Candidatus Daviesbacteria bacterium]